LKNSFIYSLNMGYKGNEFNIFAEYSDMAIAQTWEKHPDPLKDLICEDGKATYACRPETTRGRIFEEPVSKTRSDFQRDRDRIIHSNAFRRLKHKTQVFVYHEGDHYRSRLTHSIEVAQVARSLARSINIDEDLAETCALAHDLGHTPFAHVGEDALKECMEPYRGFEHNDQTLRVVTKLEKRYPRFDGLNLTWESLEGLVKHNGPVLSWGMKPTNLEVTLNELKDQSDLKLETYASVEAQVAGIADDIAYNSHDLDDGIAAGFFTLDDLLHLPMVGDIVRDKRKEFPDCPDERLRHEVIREVMGHIVLDVMKESRKRIAALNPKSVEDVRNANHQLIAFSEEMIGYDKALRSFLWENFYINQRLSRIRLSVFKVVQDLFKAFFENERCLPVECRVQMAEVPEGWREVDWRARTIADYIASMTDRKALLEHREMFDTYQALR